MRKFLAVLMAVLMIASVLAMLPASAATFDGSTKNDPAPTLFISEVAAYTQYFAYAGATGANNHALDFMEIYNNGDTPVDLSTISILRAVDFTKRADDESIYSKLDPYDSKAYDTFWALDQKFISKVDLETGKIIADSVAVNYGKFTDSDANPTNGIQGDRVFDFLTNDGVNMTLASGKNAIIWFISEATIDWMKTLSDADLQFNPRNAFLKSFYPDLPSTEYANYQIIMVWGWGDQFIYDDNVNAIINGYPAYNMFSLASMPAYNDTDFSYIFALAQDSWQIFDDKAYDNSGLNSKIYSLTRFGTLCDEFSNVINNYATVKVNSAATFTTAGVKPYIANALNKFLEGDSAPVYADYYAAGFINSYNETGVITWDGGDVTPGTMPVWQWAMVNPGHANAPEELKTSGAADATKVQATIDALIVRLKYVDDGSAGRDETDRGEIYFESQEDIANRFNNANKKNEDEGSWLEENLVLVIVLAAVVVVLGAAAVVVFVVILPKKKKAAAAAAAEVAAEEAPAEAPAEDAPADAQE